MIVARITTPKVEFVLDVALGCVRIIPIVDQIRQFVIQNERQQQGNLRERGNWSPMFWLVVVVVAVAARLRETLCKVMGSPGKFLWISRCSRALEPINEEKDLGAVSDKAGRSV